MAEKLVCSVCGKKIGGMIGGATDLSFFMKGKLDRIGVESTSICQDCAMLVIQEKNDELEELVKELFTLFHEMKVFTTPHSEFFDAEIKGIVSGYSVIGTGPLTAMASAWTDFFGQESTAYLDKIRIGENNALNAAKIQAVELGASAISGCTVTVTEATSGNGMLMVSCVGTAISLGSDDELSSKLIALQAEITALREQLKKIE